MVGWIRNSWYCAMYGDALPPGSVESRALLAEHLVLWRGQDGVVHAMEDRCPHRYAPLSMGKQVGADRIQCGYHGLEFDGSGRCVYYHPNLLPGIDTAAVLWRRRHDDMVQAEQAAT